MLVETMLGFPRRSWEVSTILDGFCSSTSSMVVQ